MRAMRRTPGAASVLAALALVLCLVLGLVLGTAAAAAAHAELVDTDPDQGAVLDRVPEEVTLTFNEAVRQVPDGVRVYDAEGHELASTARTRDEDLLVTIEDEVAAGTLVVAWRVVSTDGHPISGSLTFSIGAPSTQTSTPPAVSAPRVVSVALSLSRWPAYVGLLLAVGLVWFVGLVIPPEIDRVTAVFRRLRTTARWAAVVSMTAWVVGLLVEAVYLRGTGFDSLAETETFGALPLRELVAVAVVAVGLGGAVLARGVVASLAALGALLPVALTGHSVAMAHADLNVVVDGFHLVAASIWLGGLVGMVVVLRGTSTRSDVAFSVVRRFSTIAASVLATLVLAGSVLAWQLVGSWQALVGSAYGRVFLAKIALAAAAIAVAAYNRYRLLPQGARARHTLVRTVSAEAVVLVAVVLVTGFLVQQNPPASVGNEAAPAPARVSGQAELGDLQATVTLDPAVVGSNAVTVEIDSGPGAPAELFNAPRLRVLGDDAVISEVTLEPIALGTYRGTVVLPAPGAWRFQVSLRIDQFTNPVATVELDVR